MKVLNQSLQNYQFHKNLKKGIPDSLVKIIMELAQYISEFIADSPHVIRCAGMTVSFTAKSLVNWETPHNLHITDNKVLNVFVHGYWHNKTGFVEYEKRFLKEKMGSVLSISLSSTQQDIKKSADEVFQAIQNAKDQLDPDVKINLIGHSMGGLVASLCALKDDFNPDTVITLGSPFKGTHLARLGFGTSAKQMRRHSQFLENLVQKLINAKNIRTFAAAARRDQVIKPWDSCHIRKNHPNQHQFDNIGHLGLLFEERVIDWVVKCIKEPKTASEV